MTATRRPQPRWRPGKSPAYNAAARAYDPATPSDGLTLDTDRGPVDLVAVERALTGVPTDLTAADVAYAYELLPSNLGPFVEDAARGMGSTPSAVKRAIDRHKASNRNDRPDTQRTRP